MSGRAKGQGMRSVYRQVQKVIEHDPQSPTSMALAKLNLSLHQASAPGLSDALNRMDMPPQCLADLLLAHYISAR
jgi:hypothetical protein